jgi:hypothetical protein
MKKIYVLGLLCISLCLLLVFGTTSPLGNTQEQEEQAQQVQVPSYNLETDRISMTDLGKLLERLGKEIQQKGQVTIGGNSYPVTDFGGLEFSVGPRRQGPGTSINFELSSGMTSFPEKARTYISYERRFRMVAPGVLAEFLAKIGKTLGSKGAFVIDDHSVAFEGKAKVVQKLIEGSQPRRGLGPFYSFTFDVMFGKKDFPVPLDEEEDPKSLLPEERAMIKELVKKEITDADQKAVVKMLDSLSRDLKAGRVRVGDQDLPAGENIRCGLSHLIAVDGTSHRIRVYFQFGEAPPQQRPTGPRYSKEFFNKPMKQVGALLRRLGTEIIEKGTMKLGETEFKVKERAYYEINASQSGFEIGLSWREPPKEK